MIETLELEKLVVERYDPPKLLVEWSSPWREFLTSVRPALVRSERRLAGEAPFGLIPLRIVIPSYLLEACLILAAIFVQVKIKEFQPFVAPRFSSRDVIYYSGDELPRTQDLGGSLAGSTGVAGGGEARHRSQSIRVARGGSLVPRVVDAPNLKLPTSRDAVANLLAVQANPGPPPSEGLRSARAVPNMAATAVAPAPNVVRDYTRNGIQLQSVIAPSPSVSRDRQVTAPNFSAALIPPAPSVASEHTLVAPALAPTVIPPAPAVSRDHALMTPSLSSSLVAPAPTVARDRTRSTPALAATIIPAAPTVVNRDLSSAPAQLGTAVVQPPASAPERASIRDPKLNLPARAVIAPPPSTAISQDAHRNAGTNSPDYSKTVVPPPPTQSAGTSFMSALVGKIFGATEVVPPPPSISASRTRSGSETPLAATIVPPPSVAVTPGGAPRGVRNGMALSPGGNVVAPPPSAGISDGTGSRSAFAAAAPTIGMPNVVPPPPSLSGAGGGSVNTAGGAGTPRGTLLANNIVPPPPSVGGASGSSGSGLSRNGAGLGASLNAGAHISPPNTGGNGANSGAVLSNQPGPNVGLPASPAAGALAMSPAGGDKPGVGGSGAGSGIGRGNGPGSSLSAAGPGAAKSGAGHGSDPNARGGISPAAGPGGAGNSPSATPAVRGVDISGGTGVVTIPGFGSDSSAPNSQGPGHFSNKPRQSFDVDVVATASSGGAFEPYKNLLHGEKHTMYPETSSSLGAAAMEYAEVSTTGHGLFTPPQSIRTSLPEGLPQAHMVVACTLDASGNLKNVRVLEAGPADMTTRVVAALRSWKFQPAMRGNQPVEVTAILGFGVNTNDRF